MLADAVALLACPVCGGALAASGHALRCPEGHSFDIARQGYANLLTGNARPGTADTAAMVAARAEFLASGHYDALTRLLGERAATGLDGPVLDAGAGTGHYLRAVLDRAPDAVGLGLDISKFAARRAARAHARLGAVVADLWRPLPVRDGAVSALVNVFAPRNVPEFHRVLRPSGTLHTVTPAPAHLDELVRALGLLAVGEGKTERMDDALSGHFRLDGREHLEGEALLDARAAGALAAMGPSAHHLTDEELGKRLAALPDPFPVRLSFVLSTFRRLR